MASNAATLTILINADEKRLYLYSDGEKKGNNCVAAGYSSTAMDDGFFKEFSGLLGLYKQKYPRASLSNISLILPNHLFFTDMVTIPNIGKKAVGKSLNLVLDTLYQNKEELEYHTFLLSQTKQNAVYGLVGIRKDLLKKFREACTKNGASTCNITFAANAMAVGSIAANQKMGTATCLLLDIKENSAHFAFLNKGRTLGAYSLPFGYTILQDSRLVNEDLLFDYSSAELLVLNAKERARAKQLTVLEDPVELTVVEGDAETETEGESDEKVTEAPGGRKLPRFMLRETPTEAKGFLYENFRLFVKWTLELIAGNPKITDQGTIDTVYVNLPKEYGFLLDMVNQEKKENNVTFAPLAVNGSVSKMLELFGGSCLSQHNSINTF